MTLEILPPSLARPLLSKVLDLAPTAVDAVVCPLSVVARQSPVLAEVGLTALRVTVPSPLHETVLQALIAGAGDRRDGSQTS